MKNTTQKFATALALVAILFSSTGFKADNASTIPDFSLRNVSGNMTSTTDYKTAKGFIVIFTCNHCPFAKLYAKRMNDLNKKYSALGVPLLAINSMDTLVYADERFSKMKQKSKSSSFNFPYLQDGSQMLGKQFGAEHTPTAYIIWKENNKWRVKYKGSIDDNGEHPESAVPLVGNAVTELLQGKPVSKPTTESFGCKIFYRK